MDELYIANVSYLGFCFRRGERGLDSVNLDARPLLDVITISAGLNVGPMPTFPSGFTEEHAEVIGFGCSLKETESVILLSMYLE